MVEAEALGKVEMILSREPQKYRGSVVSFPHREIIWSLEHDASPSSYSGPVIILIGRKDSLVDSYKYLISNDVGLKNAYQYPHSSSSSHHIPPAGNASPPMHHMGYSMPPQQQMMSMHYQPYMQPMSDELNAARFKPAEFNAKRLRIGSWEKKSYYSGDLKVKFLYVKKRMVWEILDVFGLTKIEVSLRLFSPVGFI